MGSLFPIVDAEIAGEMCPLFFHLGRPDTLAALLDSAGFDAVAVRPLPATLGYADADDACDAAFSGGPAALAWSRFDDDVRGHVRTLYLQSIDRWRVGDCYEVPGEFLIAAGRAAADGAVSVPPTSSDGMPAAHSGQSRGAHES